MAKLFLVPTPIGNLEDITLRAISVLKEVDLVLAEDTRVSRKLLNHLSIDKPILSHHQNNEHKVLQSLIDRLFAGETMALISDAGTPAISDPGYLLLRECIKNDIEVDCLPGATALIPALVNSGLPADRFIFEGFLPHKKGRQTRMKKIAEEERTIILYESPHRILKTLLQLAEFCGKDRPASISREITKMHEETVRGSLEYLHQYYSENTIKGEFVLVVGGKP